VSKLGAAIKKSLEQSGMKVTHIYTRGNTASVRVQVPISGEYVITRYLMFRGLKAV
jgi:hypothetical protein